MTVMKMIRSLALAAVAALTLGAAAPGCLSGGGAPSPDWPKYVECGPDVSDLIATVTRVLFENGGSSSETLGDRARAELEDLGRAHGFETVTCLVDRLVQDWSAPGAAQTPERMRATKRGKSLLEGVDVKRSGYGPEASLSIDWLHQKIVMVRHHKGDRIPCFIDPESAHVIESTSGTSEADECLVIADFEHGHVL